MTCPTAPSHRLNPQTGRQHERVRARQSATASAADSRPGRRPRGRTGASPRRRHEGPASASHTSAQTVAVCVQPPAGPQPRQISRATRLGGHRPDRADPRTSPCTARASRTGCRCPRSRRRSASRTRRRRTRRPGTRHRTGPDRTAACRRRRRPHRRRRSPVSHGHGREAAGPVQTRSPLRSPGEQLQQPQVAVQPTLHRGGAAQPTFAQLIVSSAASDVVSCRLWQAAHSSIRKPRIDPTAPVSGRVTCI